MKKSAMTSFMIYFFMVMYFVQIANAAAIYGTVYDLSLKKVSNARVEINTVPKQFTVAQNGTYLFNAPNGAYTIKAQLLQKNTVVASVQENITIAQQGSYVLDLILFPDVEEGVEVIGIDVSSNVVEAEKKQNNFLIWLVIALIAAIIFIVFYYAKKTKKHHEQKESKAEEKPDEDDLEQVIRIIKREGSRTTQKEIRKQIPLSEAKISLMIAELEHKGIIEKIKKGRGNIIILKKK